MANDGQWLISVSLNGKNIDGPRKGGGWTSWDGGGTDADLSVTQIGGGLTVVDPVQAVVQNITLTRHFDGAEDMETMREWLTKLSGRASATITRTLVDLDFVAVGKPIIYTGTMGPVTTPGYTAGSTDSSEIQVEFAISAVA